MIHSVDTSQKPVFYPALYLVTTVTGLLLLWGITGLSSILIHYWLTGVSSILNDFILFFWAASLAVVVPMHLLAYWQLRHVDKSRLTTFSVRFGNGFLGAFLFVVVASNILLTAWLGALLLNAWLGNGDFDKHLLAAVLSLLQTIAWFRYASTHFAKVRTDGSRPKYYVIAVTALSALVLVLSIVFPAMAYREVARDLVKENDLSQLSQSVADYVDQHDVLPSDLTQLKGLNEEMAHRIGNYQYVSRGDTKFGIFAYELCATFDRSKDKGHDTGFGFGSHSAGRQCFTRTTLSFEKLSQDLAAYTQNVENGGAKLQAAIQSFLLGSKKVVDQEIAGVEGFAGTQVKQLEGNLEGLEGGTTTLDQEMIRLQGNLGGLQGDTGQLAQDFAAVEKFLHDLGCIFGGCNTNS